MDNMSDLNLRRSSSLRRATAASLAMPRQSHDLSWPGWRPKAPAGTTSPSVVWLTYPRGSSFPRTKAALLGLLAVSGVLLSVNALVGRPATSAPAISASAPLALDVGALERTTPGNLLLFEDQYQTHYGVLDTLKR
jgi:hypothetical protein